MPQNKYTTQTSTEAEHFKAWELVNYAKAVFLNIELIKSMEDRATNSQTSLISSIFQCSFTSNEIKAWHNNFSRGRFIQTRRLHPLLTDDVLEKRLLRTVRAHALEDDQGQLVTLLDCLAETFLCEGNDGSIRVHTRLFEPWQDLILVVPPLLITSAWMAKRLRWGNLTKLDSHDHEYTLDQIQNWLCDSTLPIDDDPFLDHLCRSQGLDETHMHLNGTTEAEKVWCDALMSPQSVVGTLTHKTLERESGLHISIGNGVDRLLRQEDPDLQPSLLMRRVEDAVAIKAMLLHQAIGDSCSQAHREHYSSPVSSLNHLRHLCIRNSNRSISKIATEAWLLVTLLSSFRNNIAPRHHYYGFWHYALVRAQFCRLLVQQSQNKGFDQFQYITLNELRESTEREYADRFRQIERGHQQVVDYVEGRFAPKNSPDKTAGILGRILRGYLQFLSENSMGCETLDRDLLKYQSLPELVALIREIEDHRSTNLRSSRRLRLGLVPHFIKQTTPRERHAFFSDHHVRPVCRDARLRSETDQNARALIALLQRTRGLEHLIRGIDAASNERHAGPEVFAPVFRRMRAAGIRRFTYHVGEDFAHLASGLRAISEAMMFLGLNAGCRIGHGTAAGVNPKKWWNSVQDYVVVPSEERLDDLVFAWETLVQARFNLDSVVLIEAEIRALSMKIWQDPTLTPDILVSAWKMRSLDPLALDRDVGDVDSSRREEARLFIHARDSNPLAHAHFLRRHGIGIDEHQLRRCEEEIIVFRENDVLTPKVLRTLQHAIIQRLAECTIAIETLPSSNVRISIHDGYDEHHVSNWLGLTKHPPESSISVVVGSDDPGIFATGLRQEYAHLLRVLRRKTRGLPDPHHAQSLIQRICEDSKRFRF